MKVHTKTEYHITVAHPCDHPCGIPLEEGTVLKSSQEPWPWHGPWGGVEKGRLIIMVITGRGDRAPFDCTGHKVEVVELEKPVPEWTETNRTPWTAP